MTSQAICSVLKHPIPMALPSASRTDGTYTRVGESMRLLESVGLSTLPFLGVQINDSTCIRCMANLLGEEAALRVFRFV